MNVAEIKEAWTQIAYQLVDRGELGAALDRFEKVRQLYGLDGTEGEVACLLARLGRVDEAISLFSKALTYVPPDHNFAYCLGSCLAYRGRYQEADSLFSRNILLEAGGGGYTHSGIVNFSLLHEDGEQEPRLNSLDGRRVVIDPNVVHILSDTEIVYFVSCDPHYADLFIGPLLTSLETHGSNKIGIHVHLTNPDSASFHQLTALALDSSVPIAISHENIDTATLSPDSLKSYYSIARFLVLPKLLSIYQKRIILADVDQIVVREFSELVTAVERHDVGLLFFVDQIINIIGLFSASVLFLNPTKGAEAFAAEVRRYILAQTQRLGDLPWHLDQAALAVAALHTQGLSWHPIPATAMQSEPPGTDADAALKPETIFWSVTYSQPANAEKLNSQLFRRYRRASDSG